MEVVVTVDGGITAFEALEAAAEAGLEVIVVDHHAAEPRLPQAAAVVNPNRLDDTSGHGQLAAVGVAFLLVVALNRALRADGWYARDAQGLLREDLRFLVMSATLDGAAVARLLGEAPAIGRASCRDRVCQYV